MRETGVRSHHWGTKILTHCENFSWKKSVADPGLSIRGSIGRLSQREGPATYYIWTTSPKNVWKWKHFGGGGTHPCTLPLPLDQPMEMVLDSPSETHENITVWNLDPGLWTFIPLWCHYPRNFASGSEISEEIMRQAISLAKRSVLANDIVCLEIFFGISNMVAVFN